jgi:hypothetical protein
MDKIGKCLPSNGLTTTTSNKLGFILSHCNMSIAYKVHDILRAQGIY